MKRSRFSEEQTIEGSGLASQEHRCREYARSKGYDMLEVFPDDASGAGDFMKRPGMVKLLEFLDKGSHEQMIVIFDDLKRFARDTIFHFKLRQTLSQYNAVPECLNFRFEDTPEGEFVETVFAAQGQLERLQNRRQTVPKMKARLEQCYWVFHAPVGYASGRLQSQADVKRFLETHPTFPIDIYGDVRYQRVTEIMIRPLCAGYLQNKDWGISLRKAKHEGLISFATYQKIQERLACKPVAPSRPDIREDFPLRGFVLCGDCDRPLTSCWSKSATRKRHAYSRCQYKHCPSKGKSIKRDEVEEAFEGILGSLQPSKELVTAASAMFRDRWEHQRSQGALIVQTMK
ncbi:MAG: recombinase family protein [Pseudomonadota bacterium]